MSIEEITHKDNAYCKKNQEPAEIKHEIRIFRLQKRKKGLLQNLTRYATALFLLNLGKIVYNKAMIRR